MPPSVETYETLGAFYLGRPVDGGDRIELALVFGIGWRAEEPTDHVASGLGGLYRNV